IEFDMESYIDRCVNKSSVHAYRNQIRADIDHLDATLQGDARLWVDAADFLELLHWMIVRMRGANNTVALHLLGRTLLLGVPIDDVITWPLFRELLERMRQ